MAVLWEVRDRTEEAIGMAVKPWVDPEIAELLSTYPPDQFAGPSKKPLAELRDAQGLQKPELSERVERTEHTITDPYTTNEIVVRVHRPVDTDGKVAAIFDIHGGGYVRGSYDGEDKLMDDWCPKLGCIGVAVEYRRAPETRYPGALEDSYVALKWLHDHAADLGIATERVGIYGASAGGGLAAALSLLSRDRAEFPIAFQLLAYPMIDDRQVTVSSRWDVPIWQPADNTFGWRAYLGELYGTQAIPPTAAPARARDLAGLPPAFVYVGSADGFRDEVVEYAGRLSHAQVPVELHVYPGAPHGFDRLFPDVALSRQAQEDMLRWLSRRTTVGDG